MHAYAEILKPSVITHSLLLAPESADGALLVVVRGASLLEVFTDITSSAGPRWLAEFPLQGTVTHLDSIGSGLLVVTFLQAKMVVLDWDAGKLEFATRSLHYYEKVADQSNFDAADARAHRVSVDRPNKCLAFWFQPEFAAFVRFAALADPLLPKPAVDSAQSSIINVADLTGHLRVSRIVDMALLPAYNEPTLAVLAWNQPTWTGLVGTDGANTKSLHVVAVKPGANNKLAFKRIIHVPELGYDIHQILPLHEVPGQLALLLGADQVFALNESDEIVAVPRPAVPAAEAGRDRPENWRLENCCAVQVPHAPFALATLQCGTTISIDLARMQAQIDGPFMKSPTSVCALNDTLFIASRAGNARVCRLGLARDVQEAPKPAGSSLQELYASLVQQPPPVVTLEINPIGELVSHGALSSVATIDNGLACGTEDGVVIVERELPLEELDVAPLSVDVEPGKFWLVGTTMPKNPVLITTGSTSGAPAPNPKTSASSPSSEPGNETPPKRRRTAETAERHYTSFSELYPSKRKKGQGLANKSNNVPRGIASDQLTLAARELGNTLLVVQSKALALFDARNLKLTKHETISDSRFAEIRGNHVLVVAQDHTCSVYAAKTLQLVTSVNSADLASISSSMLLHSKNSLLSFQDLEADTEVLNYDVSNLDRICEPLSAEESSGVAANGSVSSEERQSEDSSARTNADPNEDPTRKGEDDHGLVAIFALSFKARNYIGIHMGRLFAIYEPLGRSLVKRYSVPFVVNQSPIYIPEYEVLVFPGAKSHVVVKGHQAGFQCHRLQLYGDQLIDMTLSQKPAKTGPSYELAWLDTKEMLHFARLDHSIDFLSNSLPIRRIPLDLPGVSIKEVGYHDEFAAVIVGANALVPATDPDAQDDEDGESTETGDEAGATSTARAGDGSADAGADAGADANGKTAEAPACVYEGRIYVLPLTTYKFQAEPLVSFQESLLCLRIVDYGEPGDKQMIAVGTALSTSELEETNGHVRLYNIQEDETDTRDAKANGEAANGADDNAGSHEESDEPLPLELKEFASEYVRGAVSAISELMGFLAVAHGQQIHLYNFHKRLEPIGFYDTQVYMQDIKAVRNIMILGERLRGPRLLNFALNPHRVDLLASSDSTPVPANSALAPRNPVTTAVDGVCGGLRGDLVVLATTADGRLQLLQYDPDNPMSTGGPRLVPLASFYTGRLWNSTASAQMHATDDLIVYGAATDGSVFCVKPLLEGVFRTLFVLTQQIIDKEPAVAGLNPRMHRATLSTMTAHSQQLIDVNYAQQFWQLPRDRQAVYARRLGFEGMAQVQRALNTEGRDALKL